MILKKWEELPEQFQCEEVRPYYDMLKKQSVSLVLKRIFDIIVSFVLAVILLPLMLVIAVIVKIDSAGPVFFMQERVTSMGKRFRIIKFRTMVKNAESMGSKVTTSCDCRITRSGKWLRKLKLDEIPQVFNILAGQMSFVGARPEVPEYVSAYTPQMLSPLLLPAGLTSLASIEYKDESELIRQADDADSVYINIILPEKMKYNLEYLENISLFKDISIMFRTAFSMLN